MSMRWLIPLALALVAASSARAQTYTVSITANTPDLGNVVSATSGNTVFNVVSSTGTISAGSGTGVRLSTGTSRATVTITCSNVNACTTSNVAVRIGSIGTPTGRMGALTNFNAASGTATITGTPSGTNPLNLTLTPLPKTGGRTIFVGMDVPITATGTTGNATSGFYVYAIKSGSTPAAGSTAGLAIARVYRPISMSKTADLSFGRVVRPATGTGTVTVDATTGARTQTTGVGLNTPAAARAVYSVTGEGGQAFSVSVPTSFTMSATGGSVTVTTSTTASGAQVLSSTLGSAGTFGFGVGGSFPLASTTATGSYSGTFSVTVQYN